MPRNKLSMNWHNHFCADQDLLLNYAINWSNYFLITKSYGHTHAHTLMGTWIWIWIHNMMDTHQYITRSHMFFFHSRFDVLCIHLLNSILNRYPEEKRRGGKRRKNHSKYKIINQNVYAICNWTFWRLCDFLKWNIEFVLFHFTMKKAKKKSLLQSLLWFLAYSNQCRKSPFSFNLNKQQIESSKWNQIERAKHTIILYIFGIAIFVCCSWFVFKSQSGKKTEKRCHSKRIWIQVRISESGGIA